jgi:hypothetical protein
MKSESHLDLLNHDRLEVKMKCKILKLLVNKNLSIHFLLDKSEGFILGMRH